MDSFVFYSVRKPITKGETINYEHETPNQIRQKRTNVAVEA